MRKTKINRNSWGFFLRTGYIINRNHKDYYVVEFFDEKTGHAGKAVRVPRAKFHARYTRIDAGQPNDTRFIDRVNPEIWDLSRRREYFIRPCHDRRRKPIAITDQALARFFFKIPYQLPAP